MRPPRIMLRNLVGLSLGEAKGSTSSLLGPGVTALHASMTFAMLTITYGAGASLGVITPVLQVMIPSITFDPQWIEFVVNPDTSSAMYAMTQHCSWRYQGKYRGCEPDHIFANSGARTIGIVGATLPPRAHTPGLASCHGPLPSEC